MKLDNLEASYDSKKKNAQINIRVSFEDKERFKEEAKQFGLSVSEYVTGLLDHKNIVLIDGKEEILDAIEDLVDTVKRCGHNPFKKEEDNCPWTVVIPPDAVDYK